MNFETIEKENSCHYIINDITLEEYKEVLNKLHSKIIDIALEIKRICTENHIKFFLIGGSLLGAVRHGGFIPWDDDMDIGMLRSDYNRFLEVCKTQLSRDFFLANDEIDEYGLPFAKIMMKNTLFVELESPKYSFGNGIFVDVFPIDKIPDNRLEKNIHKYISLIYRNALLIKTSYIKNEKATGSIISLLSKYYSRTHSKKKIAMQLNINAQRYNKKVCKLYYNTGSAYRYGKEVFPIESLDGELPMIQFEGYDFPCPHNPKEILELLYGDYMKLPPEEKRYNRHGVVEIQI